MLSKNWVCKIYNPEDFREYVLNANLPWDAGKYLIGLGAGRIK